jgi:endopolyphosphatase
MSGCDAALSLVNLTFATLAKDFASALDFVVWTGDSVRHDSDPKIPRTMSEVKDLNTQVSAMMRETFPKIPVLPSIGGTSYPI